jgi:hypothetical protein
MNRKYFTAMFSLGIYNDNEAREIADYLRDAGIKVDLKTLLCSRLKYVDFLEGRISELQEEVKDKKLLERSDRCIRAAREVLARSTTSEDDFMKQFALQLDPDFLAKREELGKMIAEGLDFSEDEEKDRRHKEIMRDLSEGILAQGFIDVVLRRNNIKIGEEIGDRLDDPLVRIPVALEDYEEEHRLARSTAFLTLMPGTQVNIDEFSVALAGELDEDFREDYPEESIQIAGLGALLADLAENQANGRMDMEDFMYNCDMEVEEEGNILRIIGVDAARELARVLEKNNVIKMKGDTIKWLR